MFGNTIDCQCTKSVPWKHSHATRYYYLQLSRQNQRGVRHVGLDGSQLTDKGTKCIRIPESLLWHALICASEVLYSNRL